MFKVQSCGIVLCHRLEGALSPIASSPPPTPLLRDVFVIATLCLYACHSKDTYHRR